MIELLLTEQSEILRKDPRIRENFRRLRDFVNDLQRQIDSIEVGPGDDVISTILGSSLWKTVNSQVVGGNTTDVDGLPLATFRAVKYIINIFNDAESASKTMELLINNENGSLSDSIFGKIGSIIDVEVDVVVSGSDMRIRVTNNETYNLGVTIARVTL